MDPETMRAKYAAVVDGLRGGRSHAELMAEHGVSQVAVSSWAAKSGVREELAQARAEAERREAEEAREHAEWREEERVRAAVDAEQAAAAIRSVWPGFQTPQPFLGDGPLMFMITPERMLELLVKLMDVDHAPRLMPTGVALNRVLGHDVVLFHSSDSDELAKPYEWGYLAGAEYGDEHVFFTFDDGGYGFSEHGLSGWAIVTPDGLTLPHAESNDCLVVAIVRHTHHELFLQLTAGMELHLDQDELATLIDGPRPDRPRFEDEDEDDGGGEAPA